MYEIDYDCDEYQDNYLTDSEKEYLKIDVEEDVLYSDLDYEQNIELKDRYSTYEYLYG